jgi:predicted transcriptional regulator
MSTNLSVRMKKEKIKEIDEVAGLLGLDRAMVLRRIIEDGVKRERIEIAVHLYEKGDTMEQAANKADIFLWDLMDEIRSRGIRRPVDMMMARELLVATFGDDEKLKKSIVNL